MLSDVVFLNENKGFKYCFEAIMLQTYSEGCEYVNIAWVLGSKVLPCSNSSRSMALDNLSLPTLLCTAKKKKKTDWETAPKWWVKSMIKHFYRHKRQTVVFSHVKIKLTDVETPAKQTLISPMAAWKMKPLKGNSNIFQPDLHFPMFLHPSD